jgi:general L-amino acid transport system permease protein
VGACWAFIAQKFSYLMYASYPRDKVWRVDLTLVMGALLIAWLLWPRAGRKSVGVLLFFVVYPVAAFVLLHGAGWLGLDVVSTDQWGGVFVSLLVSIVGIVFSLPGGVLLALGRRSRLPIVKFLSAAFIEFVRGVPLITVLFMANTMLPLFVPESLSPDRLLRPVIGVALFASAYMAEVIRGGLQAVPKGQFEAAMAVGLGYPRMMRLVVLPQALTIVIPGIVNTFIGLFKDTTLVAIVGISDFLRTVETARLDPAWAGPTTATTGYLFAAAFYFIFCFGMSRYSQFMERELSEGRRH